MNNTDDICDIFQQNHDWYNAADDAYKKWGIPPFVTLAIMHQESHFNATAKPPRATFLWIFPGAHLSSAYGYSQALDGTWERYQQTTGNSGADRDDFDDAVDFIGWYCDQSHAIANIAKTDTYNLYLAYHEGQVGYNQGTYRRKKWLQKIAQKVQRLANLYQRQLQQCQKSLKNTGGSLWPF
ncbi:MAG: transglycosylase SLT domain-containing protein [Mariprofundales bacterium]|nr:transglycosylase SLT domain-containing protein [Mariprofundales bacterium]